LVEAAKRFPGFDFRLPWRQFDSPAGRDPAVQANLAKITRAVAAANTFHSVADEYLAEFEREGR
jgi:hypothetical protein